MTVEIERKFLVATRPAPDVLGPGVALRQGYVAAEDAVSVRIRITPSAAKLTIKAGRGVSRTEVELDVPAADAEALWVHTEGRRIEKVRHRVSLDESLVAEVDVFGGPLEGLSLVEVEFSDERAAETFEPPGWFGRDVTSEPGWTNLELSRHGRPPG